MIGRAFVLALLLFTGVILMPGPLAGQSPAGKSPIPQSGAKRRYERDVRGRVTTLNGDPVFGAKVTADVGAGPDAEKTFETNLKGEFEFAVDARAQKTYRVRVVASKEEYLNSMEILDLPSDGRAARIDLLLREVEEDPNQLLLANLISSLGPRLRAPESVASGAGPEREEYVEGARQFLDQHDLEAAVPLLAKAVDRAPHCVRCQMLFVLALFEAGSWSSATHQLTETVALNTSAEAKNQIPEPFLALGVLQSWRGQLKKASDLFSQALELDPANPLALQELGRVLVLQQNWEAADQLLVKAIKAGAPSDSHLLHAQALLALGQPDEANREMDIYLGGRRTEQLPGRVRPLWALMKTRVELESENRGSKSAVERPLGELMRTWPELKGLDPAKSQEELANILHKAGESVERFFRNFPNVSSLEEIRQERLDRGGKVRASLSQGFQYLLLSRPERPGLGLEEYRTGTAGGRAVPRGLEDGYMLTVGFASASLPFHPTYQPESLFRHLGRQRIDGHETQVVAFAQRPERAQALGAFNVGELSARTLSQGVAWVDSINYQIIRMRTDLLKPLEKFRLDRETTEIQFGEVRFKQIGSPQWLPLNVAVTVEWRGRILRNLHTYSGFKLFNVNIHEKTKGVMLPSGGLGDPE